MRRTLSLVFLALFICPQVRSQERQPFYFHVQDLIRALDLVGAPVSPDDRARVNELIRNNEEPHRIKAILDRYALFNVHINPESRVKVNLGTVKAELPQGGWKTFLIRVDNEAGITASLEVSSEQAKRTFDGGEKIYGMGYTGKVSTVTQRDINDRWLDLDLYTGAPMKRTLSGIATEYFILELYSRDAGKRAAKFAFNCGGATQDVAFRNEVSVFFDCIPSQKILLDIKDEHGLPTTASLIIKDKQGHIYPSQSKRLAPDFFFQPQIYRHDGENLLLPAGEFSVETGRGPEYHNETRTFQVTKDSIQVLKVSLRRWIDPTDFKWYSGDHHIHAAGCSHYTSPTEGVNPEDMMRHVIGEGVNVGCVLTWGPGYYHQKQFFEGKDNKLSTPDNLLRYDLEISGFPSSHTGHLVLLRLKDQYYPNTKRLEDWPTYTIPILKWAKSQNAVTGYAHSGLGLEVRNNALPNYDVPNFDGIGANEFIVAVTHNLVDFISTIDTPPTWELNIWYHTLNCGFRTRISGETDFPCMSDGKVGHGRSYVKCNRELSFDDWTEGIRSGRAYVSEGKSHLMDFTVNNVEVGENNSEVHFVKPSTVTVSAKVAALLQENKNDVIKPLDVSGNVWQQLPFWTLERARIGESRNVFVELVVNGLAREKKEIIADGAIRDVQFETKIDQSSWIALRILPSSHSNPIFVIVNNKPIRANKESAEWCLKAVDICWKQKQGNIALKEKDQAQKDYDKAREIYRQILKEASGKRK